MAITESSTPRDASSRLLPFLLILFAGSGCSALIYEIVWYQLLQLSVGSTAVSLGILLATFMGGLCIGSLALPRVLPSLPQFWQHPLRTYAGIELAIGLFGALELAIIPLVEQAYVAGAQHGLSGMLFRGLVSAICLLPPTILMGASLPAIVRGFAATPNGVSRWGLLYGGNTAGAVSGCLLAGFYLLRLYDINVATFAAVAINLAVAAFSLVLAQRTKLTDEDTNTASNSPVLPRDRQRNAQWPVYIAIALSGACALGAEVVWTRLMGLMLGATVYAFSIILAVFLIGLAFGTAAGSRLLNRVDARAALAGCQIGAAIGIGWTAYMIADALPYWPIDPLLSTSPVFTFQLDLVRCIVAILPPTLFWGASFPIAFAAAASRGDDPGYTVGGIYAANTFGAILGALVVSLALIPWIGTENSQRVLLVLSGLSAIILLVPLMWKTHMEDLLSYVFSSAIVVGVLTWSVNAVPGELIAYGRRIAITAGESTILYTAEGRNTSIAISRWLADGSIQFHVAGKVEASTMPQDMKLERMLGHISALLDKNPESVLVVGFGAGITAGSFTTYPSVKRIVICELEPLIPPTSTKYFAVQNYNVMNDKRTEIVYDDARHYVLTTTEKFDVITSDPIHPFVKGSATLYSKEYFEMVKAHLKPGGIVTQWVPLYESDLATVKSEIATFFEVFPYGTIYSNTVRGKGYDVVLVGQMEAPKVDLDAVQARLDRADHAAAARSLNDVDILSAADLFGTYTASKADLQPWLKDAEINRDDDLRLQYLAGLALNNTQEDIIYRIMLSYRKLPHDIFTGSKARLDALFNAMETKPKRFPDADQ